MKVLALALALDDNVLALAPQVSAFALALKEVLALAKVNLLTSSEN